MAIQLGKQRAKVGKMYIDIDTKNGNKDFINVQAYFDGGDKPLYKRVYITAKSIEIAHAQLKKLGFDSLEQSTAEINDNPSICEGNEFDAIVVQNGQYQNYEIDIERPKKTKQHCESLDALLKRAEPHDEEPESDIPF